MKQAKHGRLAAVVASRADHTEIIFDRGASFDTSSGPSTVSTTPGCATSVPRLLALAFAVKDAAATIPAAVVCKNSRRAVISSRMKASKAGKTPASFQTLVLVSSGARAFLIRPLCVADTGSALQFAFPADGSASSVTVISSKVFTLEPPLDFHSKCSSICQRRTASRTKALDRPRQYSLLFAY